MVGWNLQSYGWFNRVWSCWKPGDGGVWSIETALREQSNVPWWQGWCLESLKPKCKEMNLMRAGNSWATATLALENMILKPETVLLIGRIGPISSWSISCSTFSLVLCSFCWWTAQHQGAWARQPKGAISSRLWRGMYDSSSNKRASWM